MSNYTSKEGVTHLMWAFLIAEHEESLRGRKAVQGLLWEWTGSVARYWDQQNWGEFWWFLIGNGSSSFLVQCSQIIFQTRAKSSTERDELLLPAAVLSTLLSGLWGAAGTQHHWGRNLKSSLVLICWSPQDKTEEIGEMRDHGQVI